MDQTTRRPVINAHTHIFCWGENPAEGFLSQKTRSAWLTRLLLRTTGLRKEPGETISDKIRHRLLRQLQASQLDYAVVLAQDAVYREDGSRDDAATHFYVSNDYVLRLAADSPAVLPGCSINPLRRNALRGTRALPRSGLPPGEGTHGHPRCRSCAGAVRRLLPGSGRNGCGADVPHRLRTRLHRRFAEVHRSPPAGALPRSWRRRHRGALRNVRLFRPGELLPQLRPRHAAVRQSAWRHGHHGQPDSLELPAAAGPRSARPAPASFMAATTRFRPLGCRTCCARACFRRSAKTRSIWTCGSSALSTSARHTTTRHAHGWASPSQLAIRRLSPA